MSDSPPLLAPGRIRRFYCVQPGVSLYVSAMELDAILGCVVVAAVLIGMIALVWWARRTINWISRTGNRSARKIMKDSRSGR